MAEAPLRATVIVLAYNNETLLPACLDALRRTALPAGSFETWVVDNASVDASAEVVERNYPEVRLIRSPVNLGFAGGNNLALRQVRTPYAVLLNSDAVPEPDYLANLLAPFEAPGNERLAAVTPKIVFAPRFLRLQLSTTGFVPGPQDSRELGVRIHSVVVADREVAPKVLWERLTFGPEGPPAGRFWWTRPTGELLVPVMAGGRRLPRPVCLRVTWAAETAKTVRLGWPDGGAELPVSAEPTTVTLDLPAGTPLVDVINNAGGIVLAGGYGADRGYQEVDDGQYDEPVEVFAVCGNGVAFRTGAGQDLGWFDDDFFLYYEDTDLSWRLRSRGWSIQYEPSALVRHIHSASTEEYSPLWLFHVDRNRLLMLTKEASWRLALPQLLRYPLTTGSMGLRALRLGLRERRRPPLRRQLLQLRVLLSYFRLLPAMLVRRREIGRTAQASRRQLEQWLTTR